MLAIVKMEKIIEIKTAILLTLIRDDGFNIFNMFRIKIYLKFKKNKTNI